MTKHNSDFPIKLFVFGTLRKNCRLSYYTDGNLYAGKYYTEGQLMISETGSAYIDFSVKKTATIGELYYMDFSSLLRIDHLESTSGEFPKSYDLDIAPIWKINDEGNVFDFSDKNKSAAFVYKRRNEPVKIVSGDWTKRPTPLEEIKKFLKKNDKNNFSPEDLIIYIRKYLNK